MLGVLIDALGWINEWIKIEANSANDNPLFDPQTGEVLSTGNFYGGHMAFAMDALKMALASAADMSDRQVAILVNPTVSRGLPADLVLLKDDRRLYNHAFQGAFHIGFSPDSRGPEIDHAGGLVLAFDGIPQPGQGQHGHDCGEGRRPDM